MDAKTRVQTCRLIGKLDKHPEFAKKLKVKPLMVSYQQVTMRKRKENK